MLVQSMPYPAGGLATDPYLANVVLLMGFEGADGSTIMADEGPLARGNATVLGNAQIDTGGFKFGSSSLQLDGTGDWITYADSADWLFPGDFTVECWVQSAGGLGTGIRGLIGQFNSSTNQRSWLLRYTNNGLAADLSTLGSNVVTLTTTIGGWVPVTGQWYHVAMDRSGSTVRLYLDGVVVDTYTVSGTLFNSPAALHVGSYASNTSTPWIGRTDEVRVTKGVARYAGAFTPPTSAFPRS